MTEKTLELISQVLEENSKYPGILREEDGTAYSIAVQLSSYAVPYGLRIAFFHVNDTGRSLNMDAYVKITDGVTDPEPLLYEALNAVNYELMTDSGVRVYLDIFEKEILLECRAPAAVSGENAGEVCMTMVRDLETALDICGKYPMLFADPGEDELCGTESAAVSGPAVVDGALRSAPRAERRRDLRESFSEHKRRRAILGKEHRTRMLNFLKCILELPDIDLTQDSPFID